MLNKEALSKSGSKVSGDCKRQCSTSWLVLVDDAQGSEGSCQKAEYTGRCGKGSLKDLRFLVDFTVSSQ